ncbi:MAG: caspase family protein [Chloroflexaceae bacterium]|nr:caspase family protein [Chloroflexaceae bacterium]
MNLTRRRLLQQAGSTLLGVAVGSGGLVGCDRLLAPRLKRYEQALAAAAPRKLALLVGINEYPNSVNLGGCLSDVELQRELLLYRFGFSPSDILVLTDRQATHAAIETAFREHLIAQAGENDVVVFHFSGYGSQFSASGLNGSGSDSSKLVPGLVPWDGILSVKNKPVANQILLETLLLLAESLKTQRYTLVLDASYASTDDSLQGNLRLRSCPNEAVGQINGEELAFQMELRQGNLPKALLGEGLGVLLAAAAPGEIAAESVHSGFSAGLFTYGLTQFLWQAAPGRTVVAALAEAAQTVAGLAGQQQQPTLQSWGKKTNWLTSYHKTGFWGLKGWLAPLMMVVSFKFFYQDSQPRF